MNELDRSYARCRSLNRRNGKTYYWATHLLERSSQRHVHALYGLCRYVDDIVDDLGDASVQRRRDRLTAIREELEAGLANGHSEHPVLQAVVHTARVHNIADECFRRFFRSMEADLDQQYYETFDDLSVYMDGSAAVIGEMVLPVLRTSGTFDADAFSAARHLGIAFQLTNFLRDVGEDLRRGRVYLPQEDLRRFQVNPTAMQVDDNWRQLMQFEIERNREIYKLADAGIDLLPRRSRGCVSTARVLYSRILDEIERNDYDVFERRAGVSTRDKTVLTASTLLRRSVNGSRVSTLARRASARGTTGARKP